MGRAAERAAAEDRRARDGAAEVARRREAQRQAATTRVPSQRGTSETRERRYR